MPMAVYTLMVLERSIEASYMTVSFLGEPDWWNEIEEIKYEYEFPVEYTWIPHVPVWDRAGRASRAPSYPSRGRLKALAFGFFRPLAQVE